MEIKRLIKNKVGSLFCIASAMVGLASCGLSISSMCPYTITNGYVEVGSVSGNHRLAGAYIDVLNNSERTMSSAEISFMLFDSSGKSLGQQSATVDLNIFSGEETEVVISLDRIIGTTLDKSYVLDFVHLRKIIYEDGSFWVDPLGVTSKW